MKVMTRIKNSPRKILNVECLQNLVLIFSCRRKKKRSTKFYFLLKIKNLGLSNKLERGLRKGKDFT